MRQRVTCIECDSEYTIEYQQGCITDNISYCVICSATIESEQEIEEEYEDDVDL